MSYMDIPKMIHGPGLKLYKLENVSVTSDEHSNVIRLTATYRKKRFFEKAEKVERIYNSKGEMKKIPSDGISVASELMGWASPDCTKVSALFTIVPNNGMLVYNNEVLSNAVSRAIKGGLA